MLSVDALHRISRHLARENQAGHDTSAILQAILNAVYELPQYQSWLQSDQYFPMASPRARFRLPATFGGRFGDEKWLLQDLQIINGDLLELKVDRQNGRVHVTDGNWVNPNIRVYPYTDESDDLIEFVRNRGIDSGKAILIDPACGCGHHALGLAEFNLKVSLDVNLRALAMARINASISGGHQMLCSLNDIRYGLPEIVHHLDVDSILYVANMPFAIFPASRSRFASLAQDGGERGIDLTKHAMKAGADLIRRNPDKAVDAAVLCYSIGNPSTGWWEVEDIGNELTSDVGSSSFHLLEGKFLWRVDGKKEQANPMPLKDMRLKARCQHTFTEDVMDETEIQYDEMAVYYKSEYNATHLGYGVVWLRSQ